MAPIFSFQGLEEETNREQAVVNKRKGLCLEGENWPEAQESQNDTEPKVKLFCSKGTNSIKEWIGIFIILPNPPIFVQRNVIFLSHF